MHKRTDQATIMDAIKKVLRLTRADIEITDAQETELQDAQRCLQTQRGDELLALIARNRERLRPIL